MPFDMTRYATPAPGPNYAQNAAWLKQTGFTIPKPGAYNPQPQGPKYSGTNEGLEMLRKQGFQVDTPGYSPTPAPKQTAYAQSQTRLQSQWDAALAYNRQNGLDAQGNRNSVAYQKLHSLDRDPSGQYASMGLRASAEKFFKDEQARKAGAGGDTVTAPGFPDNAPAGRPGDGYYGYGNKENWMAHGAPKGGARPGSARPIQQPSQGTSYNPGGPPPGWRKELVGKGTRSERFMWFGPDGERYNAAGQWGGDDNVAPWERRPDPQPSQGTPYGGQIGGRYTPSTGGDKSNGALQFIKNLEQTNPNSWTDDQWADYRQAKQDTKIADSGGYYRGQDGQVYRGGGYMTKQDAERLRNSPISPSDTRNQYGQWSSGKQPAFGQNFGQEQFPTPALGAAERYGPPSMYETPGSTFGGGFYQGPMQQMYQQSMNAWTMPKQQLLQWGQQLPATQTPAPNDPYSLNVSGQFGNNLTDMWNNIGGFIQGVNNQSAQKPVGTYLGQGNPGADYAKVNYNVPQLIQQGQQMVQNGWQNPFASQPDSTRPASGSYLPAPPRTMRSDDYPPAPSVAQPDGSANGQPYWATGMKGPDGRVAYTNRPPPPGAMY